MVRGTILKGGSWWEDEVEYGILLKTLFNYDWLILILILREMSNFQEYIDHTPG